MLIETLKRLFARDLGRLEQEIKAYSSEKDMWIIMPGIHNSGGNLCLHLMGNLNTYIGKEMGGIPYERNREQEFALRDIPRAQLLEAIAQTLNTVLQSLDRLQAADLEKEFPLLVLEAKTSTGYLLVHLAMHLSYHLGQINYHRRMVGKAL